MKSIEISFPGSSDQFELNNGVLEYTPWGVYARGFIGLKHVAIIDDQLSATNLDFIWSWKIYPSKSG